VQIRRRLATTSPATFVPDLGARLHNLSIGLSEIGRYEEALAATEGSVQVLLGNQLSEIGRPEEAVVATEEAAQIRRQLATANPAAFRADLADVLLSLARHKWADGRKRCP
jgi:hypothetical protein